MVKKIIIHAGLPKTATSFLQENVFPLIPKTECDFNPISICNFLRELSKEVIVGGRLSPDRIQRMRASINLEMARLNTPVLLVSIESILPIHCGGFDKADYILSVVKQLFENAEIVVFLREQVSWIRSSYSFCLVSKYILPFDQFVNRTAEGQFGIRIPDSLGVCVFDYTHSGIRQLIDRYFNSSYFFSYEELFENQDRVLGKLARIIGVSDLTVCSGTKVNKALDEGLMVILSNVLACIPFREKWQLKYLYLRYSNLSLGQKLRYLYLRKSGQLAMLVSRMLYRYLNLGRDKRLFSSQEEKLIREFYKKSNFEFWESEADNA